MKMKQLSLIALIIATIANSYFGLILIIIGAHIIPAVFKNSFDKSEDSISILLSIFIIISLISLVIAYVKNKIGGILITISAIALISTGTDDLHFGQLPQYILLFSGILLLISEYGSLLVNKNKK